MKHNQYIVRTLSLIIITGSMFACTSLNRAKETVDQVAARTSIDYEIDETEKQIINATNAFSFRLFKEIANNNEGKNLLFSPMGVVYTLEMLSNGANGKTQEALQQAMGTKEFQIDDINDLRRKMMIFHAKDRTDENSPTESTYMKSSSLFLSRSNKIINEDFVHTIEHDYFADCKTFKTAEDAKRTIDSWSKESSRGTINNIPSDINGNTDVMLINTLLFNGAWWNEFYPDATEKDTFTIAKNRIKLVEMMYQTDDSGNFKYTQNKYFSLLKMPYADAFHIEILLPNENLTLNELIKKLTIRQYEESVKKLKRYNYVHVSLPKFRSECNLDFEQPLSNMGLSNIFSMEADFSLISEEPIRIDGMKQVTETTIDEKGTYIEAASSCSFVTLGRTNNPTEAYFTANRPFIYFIRDYWGSICFAGIYCGEEIADLKS